MKTPSPLLEPLEARIAPAAIFTFTDVDGDLVKITTSKGVNSDLDNAAHVVGGELQKLDLSSATFGGEFAGADVTFTVQQSAVGDGHVNVGFINATGVDLGKVVVPGDLGRIIAGNLNQPAPAVKTLKVDSMGAFGTDTQAAGGDLKSTFKGGLGSLCVAGAMDGTRLSVTGGVAGKIGTAFVGGDMNGATLQIDGSIGSMKLMGSLKAGLGVSTGAIIVGSDAGLVSVGGSVWGAPENGTGHIFVTGKAGSVKVGGDLWGFGGSNSGAIEVLGNAGSIAIGGKLRGLSGTASGSLTVGGKLGTLTVGGNIEGGTANYSGSIHLLGPSGSVVIGGSILGGQAYAAGSVIVSKSLASLTLKGSLIGGIVSESGVIRGGEIGAIKIGGDMDGESGAGVSDVAHIVADKLGSVTVGGSMTGGDFNADVMRNGSILSHSTIGSITIGGSFRGDILGHPVISALESIGKISIAGEVTFASIRSGYDTDGMGYNPDARIGAVTVGAWKYSNLVAGVDPGLDGDFGTVDDKALPGGSSAIISKIASVTIRGQVMADFDTGIVAQQIGALKAGTHTYGFTAAKKDVFHLAASALGDLFAREIA